MKNFKTGFLFYLIMLAIFGCRKFDQAPLPSTELVGSNVYNSNSTAGSAVTGLLATMVGSNSIGGGPNGITALAGLSADEFNLYPGAQSLLGQVYQNAQQSTNPSSIWSDCYNFIFQANAAIAGISASPAVSSSLRNQFIGESQFIRAFSYFYLVNLYGDVPLVLTTNYQVNEALARSPQADIYNQITADLLSAQALLSQNYLTPGGVTTLERVRPNIASATALLARVYLFEGKYDSAEFESTNVIGNGMYQLVMDLDSAFLAGNAEAILQLEPPDDGFNAQDGATFVLSNFGGPSANFPFILSDSLEYHFEPGDQRAIHWTDSMLVGTTVYYYPYKYKLYFTGQPPVEYPTLLRLAEQYLIRAEARAQQGNLNGPNGALADLNFIRQRAGLPPNVSSTQPEVLTAILNERRMELFMEYGHRWLDLKRTQQVNAVMSLVTPGKGGIWQATDTLYPIPLTDIKADLNIRQNPGYN